MKHYLEVPEAFREFVEKRARYKAMFSGRGAAKSTTFAVAALLRATKSPARILCCREVQRTIKESSKHEIDNWIGRANLHDFFVSTANTITGANGSMFMFEGLQTARALQIQSLANVDIVWVEEASTVSQRSLDVLIPTIRKNGSEIWFAWNPRSPRDPVDAMFRATDIADAPVPPELAAYYDKWALVKEVQIEENKFFPEVLRVEMERDRVRDPDKYKHIWRGQYAHRSDAAVFKNWRIDTVDVPPGSRPFYGADWGFSIDPTVLVRCYIIGDRVLYIDAEVSGVGIEIDKTPTFFDTLANGLEDELHPRKWPIMADSARPETISYMQKHGYPQIERARKGPGSVEEGVEFIKSYDVIISPNCKRVIDEFTYYSYERDKQTDEVLPKFIDDHNHTVDAVRYAVEAIRRTLTVHGGFGVVSTQRQNFGDFGRQDMENPTLSPKNPNKQPEAVRGLVW